MRKNVKKTMKVLLCGILCIVILCPAGLFLAEKAGIPIRVYGNYGSLNFMGSGEPVDFLDRQFQIYNEQYQANGGFDREAAQEFVDAVKSKMDKLEGTQWVAGQAATVYFEVLLSVKNAD